MTRTGKSDANEPETRDGAAEEIEAAERTARVVGDELRRAGGAEVNGEEIRKLVVEIVRGIGLEVDVTAEESAERIRVTLRGADERRLLERHGELLLAIEYLVGKVTARGERPGTRIEVDAGGFRERRQEELSELARKTATAVRQSGKRALLPPMTPAERRHIHLALAEDPDVATESEGDGYKKRVAIFLKQPPE